MNGYYKRHNSYRTQMRRRPQETFEQLQRRELRETERREAEEERLNDIFNGDRRNYDPEDPHDRSAARDRVRYERMNDPENKRLYDIYNGTVAPNPRNPKEVEKALKGMEERERRQRQQEDPNWLGCQVCKKTTGQLFQCGNQIFCGQRCQIKNGD
jgi:hypothetical protein